MKKQDVSYQDKINELRLDMSHPKSVGICFVLLEGKTDVRLFRKLFHQTNCKVENIPGGKHKVESAVSELLESKYKLVIGIRDADFINLSTEAYSKPNMFLTDFHDMEMMLIAEDECIKSIVYEYFDSTTETLEAVREVIFATLEKISLLKWLNDSENLKLSFKDASFQNLIQIDTMSIDFKVYFINRLLPKSTNAEIKNFDIIESKIDALKALNKDPFQLCNGHDFIDVLSEFIRKKGHDRSVKDTQISRDLRMIYSKDNFQKTKLYASIKSWANNNNCNILN